MAATSEIGTETGEGALDAGPCPTNSIHTRV